MAGAADRGSILEVKEENHGTDTRRFCLPAGHVEPLIDCGSLNYIVPLAQLLWARSAHAIHPERLSKRRRCVTGRVWE